MSNGSWQDSRCGATGAQEYEVVFGVNAMATNAGAIPAGQQLPLPQHLAGSNQYNFRTMTFGINVPGTGFGTTDPSTGLGAISYDVQEAGDSFLVDANLTPRVIALPSVWIQSASARIGGGPLQIPLTDDQLKSMNQYVQPEFQGMPPGAAYSLRISNPNVGSLCGADDVEVYVNLIYWVANGP